MTEPDHSPNHLFSDPSSSEELLFRLLLQEEGYSFPSQGPTTSKPIEKRSDLHPLPASIAQQRFWVLEHLHRGSAAYHVLSVFSLHGPLHLQALDESLQQVIARQQSLRMTFRADRDGHPFLRVHPYLLLPFPLLDFTQLQAQERRAVVLQSVKQHVLHPFDLEQGPLLRCALLRDAPDVHLFVLAIHHLVTDGWSMTIFSHELMTFYEALCRGEEPKLPALPIEYSDYAFWQHQQLQGELRASLLSYWTRQLAGVPPLLALPTDHPRPSIQGVRGAHHDFQISDNLTQKLKRLGQEEEATLFMTLLTAFDAWLLRWCGQEDLVVGTVIANRTRPEVEHLIGLFANTLIIRTDASGSPSFRTLLRRVRATALEAYKHQEMPFEQIVDALHLDRTLSHQPLAQVMFVLQDNPGQTYRPGHLQMRRIPVENDIARFDLLMQLAETATGLEGTIEYNTDLFEANTIQRVIEHWRILLDGILRHPDQPLTTLPFLSPIEHEQLRLAWQRTHISFPLHRTVSQLFEAQVERTPDAIALFAEDAYLTYHTLNAQADELAKHLRLMGVGPDVAVGICLPRSPAMLIGLLAILKAGGAYVPLDPSFPAERLAFLCHDARLAVLVTTTSLLATLPTYTALPLCLDTAWASTASASELTPQATLHPENLAYVIYTSGSTGQPKGVQVSHRALTNFLLAMCLRPSLSEQEILLAVTTLSFDIAGLELFLPLVSGARVVLASREVASNGQLLATALKTTGATMMQATPATWRLLLEAGWSGDRQLRILCGGEALPLWLAQQLLERCATLWNMYGPTETTIWSLALPITSSDQEIGIGGPIANTQVYLLDPTLQAVPVGLIGELYLGGQGLARGYRGRPDLTAERFVPDPFAQEPGSRLYRTGDLGRLLPDGTIAYLGRADSQVKVRGYRIELGEIETVIEQYQQVGACAVIVWEESSKEQNEEMKWLVAYVEPREEPARASDFEQALHDYLQEQLPTYMIPMCIVLMQQLPLTPNGKVDRRALSAPSIRRQGKPPTHDAPQTEIEALLLEIWAQVLGRADFDSHENFFALGGQPFLAIRLIEQIREALEIDLLPGTLFTHPTIHTLAAKIEESIINAIDSLSEEEAQHALGDLH